MKIGLMHVLIDPCFVPLVHPGEHDLSFHIFALIGRGRAIADIHDGCADAIPIRAIGRIRCRHDVDIGTCQRQ